MKLCANINLSQIITDSTRPNSKYPSTSSLIETEKKKWLSEEYLSSVLVISVQQLMIRWNFKYFDKQSFLNDLLASDIHDIAKVKDDLN